jgi:hypothetical protein
MLLTRREIIRAMRIRRLLEQADSEDAPAAAAYRAKALALARSYPAGRTIIYNGRPLLGDDYDGHDGHPDLPGHRDDQPAV